MSRSIFVFLACVVSVQLLAGQTNLPVSAYHIYSGSTHAHTSFTTSHGAQFKRAKDAPSGKKESLVQVSKDGVQTATKNMGLRHDWQKVQGPPSVHYVIARKNGYDFYVTSDHSQDTPFHPVSATNAAWTASKLQAQEATDSDFVAIAGYEHSENNGPGGKGHINVINSAAYLNAFAPGVDLPFLYKWLETAQPNGDGLVVATFNHPGEHQYDNWSHRDGAVTDVITMLEVINGQNHIHYAGFIAALDHGWKVSPVCGHDNHGTEGIAGLVSRTFVLATNKTKAAILDGMKNRRTYAALDRNIQCRYTVNGLIMGSTLNHPADFHFEIELSDPDTTRAKDKITKVDIVKDGGKVVESFSPEPAFSVHWSPTIRDANAHYFFVRVWSAGGGDVPQPKPNDPVAWLAPVWTGRDSN
ncbi:MAG: hypothetical protein ACXWDN_07125 [Limisphaerales bacterium]